MKCFDSTSEAISSRSFCNQICRADTFALIQSPKRAHESVRPSKSEKNRDSVREHDHSRDKSSKHDTHRRKDEQDARKRDRDGNVRDDSKHAKKSNGDKVLDDALPVDDSRMRSVSEERCDHIVLFVNPFYLGPWSSYERCIAVQTHIMPS